MLNPNSPVPLYHQLADMLIHEIQEGEYAVGDPIPSETGLAKLFKIGRPTVRQAMDVLVRKGLVERRRGSGTYVKDPGDRIDLFSLAGTSKAFNTKGIDTTSKIIDPVSIKAVDQPDNPFHRSTAYYFSRVTCVGDEPVLYEIFFLHPKLVPGFENHSLENQSLSNIISDHYYLTPVSGRQVFKVCCLPAAKAALLAVKPDTPILEVQRFLNFQQVEGAIYSVLYCRTDRFEFSQEIQIPDF
jgi:GntR family transcriptional regulator